MIIIPSIIQDNLKSLIADVTDQLANLSTYLQDLSPQFSQHAFERDAYVHNLNHSIHNACLSEISRQEITAVDVLKVKVYKLTAANLERISELCLDCVRQIGKLAINSNLFIEDYNPLLKRVMGAIAFIEEAIKGNDVELALIIGQTEIKLNQAYQQLYKKHIAALKIEKDTERQVFSLLVSYNMKQMGDALLKVSESIISANLGQETSRESYYSLKASISRIVNINEQMHFYSLAKTRSGSAVFGLSVGLNKGRVESDDYVAIFKDGAQEKLHAEHQGIESWHEIYPGIAPKVLSYQNNVHSAALLMEPLRGVTFEKILLCESLDLCKEAMERLNETLESVWGLTYRISEKPVSYMQQLAKRLDRVYSMHPEFCAYESHVCGCKLVTFDSLLGQAMVYEQKLKAPFSVYIHGDFNLDNIIYDPRGRRINFIDLHRSCHTDYVQDVSVFMVSIYRLQILDLQKRKRMMKLAQEFYLFARNFAKRTNDETFEIRLALGLVRSFATSTRFIFDKSLAKAMFLRAQYLLAQLLKVDPAKTTQYRIPLKEIFIA